MLASDKKADYLQVVYRQYSRQRANHYRVKYPRLMDSDIAGYVCEEWEELNEDDQERLFLEFSRKGYISLKPLDDNQLHEFEEQGPKMVGQLKEEKDNTGDSVAQINNQKEETDSYYDRYYAKSEPNRELDRSHSEQSSDEMRYRTPQEQFSDWQERESKLATPSPTPKKHKSEPRRCRNGEYVQFYKFYYERLAKEHPRWSGIQLTNIIVLLWKKRQLHKKKEMLRKRAERGKNRVHSRAERLKNRKVTAYDLFVRKRIEDTPSKQPKQIRQSSYSIWRSYHQAGKNYFKRLAQQHNKHLSLVPDRPKLTKKEEETNTTQSGREVLAFMRCPMNLNVRSIIKKKEQE